MAFAIQVQFNQGASQYDQEQQSWGPYVSKGGGKAPSKSPAFSVVDFESRVSWAGEPKGTLTYKRDKNWATIVVELESEGASAPPIYLSFLLFLTSEAQHTLADLASKGDRHLVMVLPRVNGYRINWDVTRFDGAPDTVYRAVLAAEVPASPIPALDWARERIQRFFADDLHAAAAYLLDRVVVSSPRRGRREPPVPSARSLLNHLQACQSVEAGAACTTCEELAERAVTEAAESGAKDTCLQAVRASIRARVDTGFVSSLARAPGVGERGSYSPARRCQ
jgi:hypothetical protein